MKIPKEVKEILEKLQAAGYEAFIVGGCVRDLLMGAKPQDWDVTTSARPEEIQKLFPDSFYENKFGTVGVHPVKYRKAVTPGGLFDGVKTGSEDPELQVVEITTYRIESKYTDKRHPDRIIFADKLEDDLKRRDFTVNSLAMDIGGKTIDLFDGQIDIKNKLIRAVGEPDERVNEDALRMMRAIRFAATLGFTIEEDTMRAIKKNHGLMAAISKERIRDELVKIINS